MIGWGRGRYLDRLDAYRKRLEADLKKPAQSEEDVRTAEADQELRRTVQEVGRLREVLKDLLNFVPASGPGEGVDFGALASGLAEALGRFVRVRPDLGDRDGGALGLITAELSRIAEEACVLSRARGRTAQPLRLDDALERLRAAAASLTVGASSPLAGHLHISSFGAGGFSGRPATFVVGLNDTAVPGEGPQDPILLDAEREAISESLPTTADALKANLYTLATVFAALRGRVVLSYSSYDIMDERRLYPSSVLLQALRLVRGEPGLDYSDLDLAFRDSASGTGRTDPAGFIPDDPAKTLDERDWWLGRLVRGGRFLDGLEAVKACFPVLRDGIAAAEARGGAALTAYEGLVRVDRDRYDPLRNHDLILSASRLELLAKCPYGYFLRYILRVEPPRDLELDRSRWLDPMQRGSLVHRILFEFMSEVTKRGERVSPAAHASLMDGIAVAAIREWRNDVPPPSEGIFDKERRDILEALDIFLRVEGGRGPNVLPFAFEKEFKDLAIEAGRGWFKLRGFIDRIDRTGPGAYRIVDYKTGSYRDFEDLEAFDRGRRIQHALYALAAEKILGDETGDAHPRVTESGYFFPTRRGEGREIMVGPFDRGKLRELLSDLLALISNGYFVTTTKDDCSFCDFAPVCGGAFDGTKRKLPANPEVADALDRLKRYA
jgi:ATP-dependent helicase/nuclease subunit B